MGEFYGMRIISIKLLKNSEIDFALLFIRLLNLIVEFLSYNKNNNSDDLWDIYFVRHSSLKWSM